MSQVGVTSWGVGCGQSGVPGAYASVSSSLCFIDWALKCKENSTYVEYIDVKVILYKFLIIDLLYTNIPLLYP